MSLLGFKRQPAYRVDSLYRDAAVWVGEDTETGRLAVSVEASGTFTVPQVRALAAALERLSAPDKLRELRAIARARRRERRRYRMAAP